MKDQKDEGQNTDDLIAKYSFAEDGGFPYPTLPDNASDELTKEVNRVRGAVRRKAQGALVDFVTEHKDELELTPYQQKALDFLTTERARGRKGEGKGRITVEEKVYNFFADTSNHVDSDGTTKTPGKVAAVNVYIALDMDPMRVLGAAKRILDTREADERIWISYSSSARAYAVFGPQADAPKGWTGPVPAPKAAEDLDNV